MRTPEWNIFWKAMDLKKSMDPDELLRQCQLFSADHSGDAYPADDQLVATATYLVKALGGNKLVDPNVRELHIVPCKPSTIQGAMAVRAFATLNESVNDYQHWPRQYFTVRLLRTFPVRYPEVGQEGERHPDTPSMADCREHLDNVLDLARDHWRLENGLNSAFNITLLNYAMLNVEGDNELEEYFANKDIKIPVPGTSMSIAPSDIVLEINDIYQPYFYSFRQHYAKCHNVLCQLGANRSLTSAIAVRKINAHPTPIIPLANLRAILGLFAKCNENDLDHLLTSKNVLAPKAEVHSAKSTKCKRLDLEKVNLIHPKLNITVQDIGSVVEEMLDTDKSTIHDATAYQTQLNERLKNPMIGQLTKLILELAEKKYKEDIIQHVITFIGVVQIHLATIHSIFTYNGMDITKVSEGSRYIYDPNNYTLTISRDVNQNEWIDIICDIIKNEFKVGSRTNLSILFNPNMEMNNTITVMKAMYKDNAELFDDVQVEADQLNRHTGNGVYYSVDGTNYVMDPINTFAQGDMALYAEYNTDVMISVVVGKPVHRLSHLDEIKCYHIGEYIVPSFHLFKITPFHTGYKHRMQRVGQFIKELKSSTLPEESIEFALYRLKNNCLSITEFNQIGAMVKEISKPDVQQYHNLGDVIVLPDLLAQGLKPETAPKTPIDDTYQKESNMMKANIYFSRANKTLDELTICHTSYAGVLAHDIVRWCILAVLIKQGLPFNTKSKSLHSLLHSLGTGFKLTTITDILWLDKLYLDYEDPDYNESMELDLDKDIVTCVAIARDAIDITNTLL
ncbi:hypothetical protein SAMD00019534_080710 [Acytostelium subglobosum LB1]|uniref:hypothetical protein n=1 Tax=Acytostelium subglobosum LB1 TaxID=1410327 RepID=UPI000644E3AB|nr:hypothetical protein SAMD00019534_080710 [Acytostelium subglobosum LB1]GAM24896.1 hypothetical protein SAMD00019534_080710 [Acytostelium subglobosum LB1]|eukprot:XP_012751985.1 hypothetical protein SAMD00019534_080710 [Acytostelium subglobosum LB1]